MDEFSDVTNVHTLGDWTSDFYGKNWESDQNVVTAQLLRLGICSPPIPFSNNEAYSMFMESVNPSHRMIRDSKTFFKGQGYGECRSYNLGNTWYEEVGGCPWFRHWYPLKLLLAIVNNNQEGWFMDYFQQHLLHDERLERLFFDDERPYK